MRYWDASAVVPLVVVEEATASTLAWLALDSGIVTWWGTRVECASALTRRAREGALREAEIVKAIGRLEELADTWHEIAPSDPLRRTSLRLLRSHALRSADALQLAAAIAAADGGAAALPFVTLDARLAEAASREGFPILSGDA